MTTSHKICRLRLRIIDKMRTVDCCKIIILIWCVVVIAAVVDVVGQILFLHFQSDNISHLAGINFQLGNPTKINENFVDNKKN